MHSGGYKRFPNQTDPGEHLMRLYHALLKLPRWQRNGGQDFMLYDPHPGFVLGNQVRHGW